MSWALAFAIVGMGICVALMYMAELVADVKRAKFAVENKVSITEYTLTDRD